MKLRQKLFFTYLVVAVVPLFLVFILYYVDARSSLISVEASHLEEITNLKVLAIENYFSGFEKDIGIVQQYFNIKNNLPVLEKYASDKKNSKYIAAKIMLDDQLRAWMENRGDVYDVMLFSPSGRFVYGANESHVSIHGKDYSQDYYQKAINGGEKEIFIGNIFKESLLGEAVFHFLISAPIYDFNDNFVGIVMLEASAQKLYDTIQNIYGLGETGETLIAIRAQIDGSDKILFINPLRYDPNAAFVRTADFNDKTSVPIQQALSQKNGSGFSIDYRGVQVLAVWRYIPGRNWGLVTKVDRSEVLVPVTHVAYITLLIGIIAIILSAFISWLFSRRISRPIVQLSNLVKNISSWNLDFLKKNNFSVNRRDEIGILANDFKKMAASVQDSRLNLEKKVFERTQDLEKFKMALDGVANQVIITDKDGTVLYANKATEKITGYRIKDVLGKKAGKLWGKMMPKAYYDKMWATIKIKKKVFVGELTNMRKEGEKYEAALSISPILDKRGNVLFFVGIERDITEEKNIERAKSEFVSLVSHQMRTPLTAIKWNLETLEEKMPKNLREKSTFKDIYNSNERMIRLINAFLNVSRIETGTFSISPKKIKIVDIVKNMLKELKLSAKKKKIKISEYYGKNIGEMFLDPNIKQIIFQNLLSNAIKYTPVGGRIKISIEKIDGKIFIKISDNGCGIPKNQQKNIFKKMFRADNARKIDADGNGLGLYMVKSLVEKVGGKIWFESKENKGTTFYVELPVKNMIKNDGTKELILSKT